MKLSQLLREDSSEYRPPSDAMQLMADFYVLGFLSSGPFQSTSHRQDELDFEVRYATKILLPHLREHLLEMAGNSIASELSHVFDYAFLPEPILKSREVQFGPYDKHDLPHDEYGSTNDYQAKIANYMCAVGCWTMVDQLYQTCSNSSSWEPSHKKSIALDMSEYNAVARAGSKAFRQLQWDDAYGGEPWAVGCDTWLALYGAKSTGDVSVYCDKLYSIQHNNGAFLDKNPEYLGEWVEQMLDIKFEARDPEELIRFASPHMRRLALKILRTRYGRSWDQDRWGNTRQNSDDLVKNGAVKNKVIRRLEAKFDLDHQKNGNLFVKSRSGDFLALIDFQQIDIDNRIKINLYISGHPTFIWSHNITGVVWAVEDEEKKVLARHALEKKAGGGRETA